MTFYINQSLSVYINLIISFMEHDSSPINYGVFFSSWFADDARMQSAQGYMYLNCLYTQVGP